MIDIPSRSRLYKIEPIGIGTPYVESLRSYIGRLAYKHSLSQNLLISRILVPEINEKREGDKYQYYVQHFKNYDRFESFTIECVEALERLTIQEGLINLTLNKWSALYDRDPGCVNSKILRWCPKCLYEWKEQEKEVYEPLQWILNVNKVCDVHKKPLSTICPHCEKKPFFFNGRYIPGYCTRCNEWLGIDYESNEKLSQEELEWELYVTKEVGEVLQENHRMNMCPTKDEFADYIKNLIELIPAKSFSDLAKTIKTSQGAITRWAKKESIPRIHCVLLFCKMYEIKLVNLFTGKFEYYAISMEQRQERSKAIPKPREKKKKTVHYEKNDLKKVLEDIYENEYPPLSAEEVMKRLSHYNLRYMFPDLFEKIKEKRKEYRRRCLEEQIEIMKNDFERIVQELKKEGRELTQNNVRTKMEKPGRLRDPAIRKIWEEVRLKAIEGVSKFG